MHWLHRVTHKHSSAPADSRSDTPAEWRASLAAQRQESESKVILFHLDDRMRTFRPMMERILERIERATGLEIVRPQKLTYGFNDPYFPSYEWVIRRPQTLETESDPRRVILQLRASLGKDLSVIVVYYLLSFVDALGEEHPLHQYPTDTKNEAKITELLWVGMRVAELVGQDEK